MANAAAHAPAASGRQPARLLARRPALGGALVLFGGALFAFFLWEVLAQGPLMPWDLAVTERIHTFATHSSPFVKWLMLTGSFIGQNGLIFLALALGIFWIWQRQWEKVVMLVVGAGAAEVLYQVVGGLVNRHRPVFPDPIEVLHGPGFPSGHTTVGMVFFGLLAYLLYPHLQKRWQRILLVVGVIVLLLYIGISRLFQGVHYPTDVLAGYALGLAWAGLVYTPVELGLAGPGLTRRGRQARAEASRNPGPRHDVMSFQISLIH